MRRKLMTEDRRRKGITISEVLIASVLLVAATVPILKALTSVQASTISIEHKTNSLMLARAKIEDVRTKSVYAYNNSFAGTSLSLGSSYLCNVTDAAVTANLRQITVSVGYDENGNNTLSNEEIKVTLNTLVAKRW